MLGGGFLDQMNKTLKLNRENLKRSIPKPFDKDRLTEGWTYKNARLKDGPAMSPAERDRFIQRLKDDNRRRIFIRFVMVLAFGVIGLLMLALIIS